jgi:VCBS repeat-containing protein
MNVSVENHGEFARMSITLDGRYTYSLNKSGGLISITCN